MQAKDRAASQKKKKTADELAFKERIRKMKGELDRKSPERARRKEMPEVPPSRSKKKKEESGASKNYGNVRRNCDGRKKEKRRCFCF